MKTTIQVTELTHDELVNIFSTSLYGNNSLGADFDSEYYKALPQEQKHGKCFEDILADVVLSGGTIKILDLEAQDKDDFYGNLPHEYVEADNDPQERYNFDCMAYDVTLQDILKGCSNPDGYEKLHELVIDEDGDMYTAWGLVQIIVFGEEIYG